MMAFGLNGRDVAVAGTGTTDQNLVATTAKVFSWTNGQKRVVIQNHADSGGYLYVKYNGEAADVSATAYDVCLSPGDVVTSPGGLMVGQVALYATASMTFGTDFQVVGWE